MACQAQLEGNCWADHNSSSMLLFKAPHLRATGKAAHTSFMQL
jgi:hypothetical protein